MVRWLWSVLAMLCIIVCPHGATEAKAHKFKVGQVWAYKNRPQDSGSLIKIHHIEFVGTNKKKIKVFHIGFVNININGNAQPIQHTPVSIDTLQNSVTILSDRRVKFENPQAGIDEWKNAQGGVFTVSLMEIAQFVDDLVSKQIAPDSNQ